ncbi:MAG TPA: polysaccharide deacetylase family protein [Holophagaceae bacterium]
MSRRTARPAGTALILLALLACGRKETPPPAPASATTGGTEASVLAPWTWHPLGGLAVIEGEVAEPTDLVLEGRSIRETRFAEAGPVRWELYRPPEGETAVLRTVSGRVLARFEFTTRTAGTVPTTPPVRPRPAVPPPPPTPAPRPPAPAPPAARPGTSAATTRTHAAPVAAPRPLPARPTAPLLAPSETTPPASAKPAWAELQPSAPGALQPLPPGALPRWPGEGEALNLTRGPAGRKQLLLSFDGGSSAEVATEVLDTLKARGVHTTFFLTGAFIRRYPDLVRRMAAEGHEIGNHTLDHPHFAPGMRRDPAWTKARVQRELLDADAELVKVLGRPMDPWWRAPYGEQTPEIRRWAEELGYRHVGWSEGADTLDWATAKERRLYRSGTAILQRLHQRLGHDGDGLIVLMHLGSERAEGDRPAAGLGAFMDRARAEGWTFVNASTFLRELGKPAWDPRPRLALLAATAPGPRASAAR